MKFTCSYCTTPLDTDSDDPAELPVIVENDEGNPPYALCPEHAYMIPNGDAQ